MKGLNQSDVKLNKDDKMLLKFMFWLFAIPLAWADLTFGPATSEPSHISLGSFQAQSVSYGTNTTPFWQNTSPPPISLFVIQPSSIDLDTRPTGTISLTIGISGTPGQETTAQIVRLPDGANIGPSYSGISGATITALIPNIPQPTHTTTYRLIAHNDAGNSHKDRTVTVTQNPVVSGCSATGSGGSIADPTGTQIRISCQVKGFPMPVVTINQGWSPSPVTQRHFTKISGQVNTWSFSVTNRYPNQNTRTFRVTATNSSGSHFQDVRFN